MYIVLHKSTSLASILCEEMAAKVGTQVVEDATFEIDRVCKRLDTQAMRRNKFSEPWSRKK